MHPSGAVHKYDIKSDDNGKPPQYRFRGNGGYRARYSVLDLQLPRNKSQTVRNDYGGASARRDNLRGQ